MTQRRWIRNSKLLALLLKYFARAHIWVYRRTNGRLGAKLLWFPAALVTTTGPQDRSSHAPRRRCICVTATAWCCPHHSVAATTIRCGIATCSANPEVHIQIRGEHFDLIARDASDDEREPLLAQADQDLSAVSGVSGGG